jgi:hypothetical protein
MGMMAYIPEEMTRGIESPGEIASSAVAIFSDDRDPEIIPLLEHLAEDFAQQALIDHLTAQQSWPSWTDCDRLNLAFAQLERMGIIARHNCAVCQGSGGKKILEELDAARKRGRYVRGYTFYHFQDLQSVQSEGDLCLSYGASEDDVAASLRIGHEVVRALKRQGLKVEWDGTHATRIRVFLVWNKRR